MPCPHCRSVLRYRLGSTGELVCASCLLCGHPFPEHLLKAVGTFVSESTNAHSLEDEASGAFSLADALVGQLAG